MKKVIKIFLIFIASLLLLAFIVPKVFKKQIQQIVAQELNKKLNGKISFSDVNLSLFKHFPRVSILVSDLNIIGVNNFSTDTLLFAKQVDATTNIMDIIKKRDINLYALILNSPRIHLLRTVDGIANWDIVKIPETDKKLTDTTTGNFKLLLKSYEINNGYLLYKDDITNTSAELSELTHTGSGDITQDIFTLKTSTKSNSASFSTSNVPYLINTKAVINTDIIIDNKTQTYTLKSDDVNLNDLKISLNGFVQNVNDSVLNMDLKFGLPSNDFKDILSMIPSIYSKDFDKIKTSGKASFDGFVKGIYSPQQLPSYNVNLQINDGFFQYPDLPKPVKNIQLKLNASNVDGKPDNSVIDVSAGHLEIDNKPFDFKFSFKNPETIQFLDAVVKGDIDLADVSKFIKLPTGTKLSGNVSADAFVKGPLKALQNQSGAFSGGGFFNISNLFYSAPNFPQQLKNGNIKATLENNRGVADNTSINISAAHIEVGNNPIDFTLNILKPFSDLIFYGSAKGSFDLNNVKQFVTLESNSSINGLLNADVNFNGNKNQIDKKEYDKINVSGILGLTNVNYKSKEYPTGVNKINTQIKFTPTTTIVNSLSANYNNSTVQANGNLNNLIGYVLNDQTLSGTLNINTDKVNLNDWLGTTPTSSATTQPTTAPFAVPQNLNVTLNTTANSVKYDKVDYTNIAGKLLLNDEKITLQNLKTNVLEGTAVLNGYYSTKLSKTQPNIALNYDIQDMDVQKAFLSYNTIQSLMPIGKFLAGKFSSQLNVNGTLNESMFPNLKSLSGKGNLFLLKGVLQKFAPLEKLANLLQIDRLKQISTKEIKNFIEFADGKVLVKPFTLKVDNIEMVIGGFHGFDQSIDYGIQMKLPRSMLGSQGNSFINNLALQATNKGIPVKLSETINLTVKMTGNVSNPTLSVNLKEVAGDALKNIEAQAKEFAQARVDSAKQKVKDSISVIKNSVKTQIKDQLKDKIFGRDTTSTKVTTDSAPVKSKPTDVLKNTIKDLFGRKKKVETVDTLKKEK